MAGVTGVAEITAYRPEDRRAVEALYRRVFGNDAAESSRLRWEWQYGRNPNNPGREPEIWIAREGKAIVGQYATMPVRVSVRGHRGPRLVGHGRDGRSRAAAAGSRRAAVPHLGPPRRRLARARPLRVVAPAVPEAALARRRAAALPGEAADAARATAAELAAAASTGWCRPSRCRSSSSWPAPGPMSAEVRLIQRFDASFTDAVGDAGAEVRSRGPPRRGLPELEVRRRAARPLLDRGAAARRPQRRLRRLPPPA